MCLIGGGSAQELVDNFVDTLETITVSTEELLTSCLADSLSCLRGVVQPKKVAEKRGFGTGRAGVVGFNFQFHCLNVLTSLLLKHLVCMLSDWECSDSGGSGFVNSDSPEVLT